MTRTPANWVVVEKATGRAVLETFSRLVADHINGKSYAVVPIADGLASLNRKIKAERDTQ